MPAAAAAVELLHLSGAVNDPAPADPTGNGKTHSVPRHLSRHSFGLATPVEAIETGLSAWIGVGVGRRIDASDHGGLQRRNLD